MLLLDDNGIRVLRAALIVLAVAGAGVFLVRSPGPSPVAVQTAEQQLDSAELERGAAAARAAAVNIRAAAAREATRPALARVESLRSRVAVERAGQLRVLATSAATWTEVPVPPLVTERIQADSAAIAALTRALTWDTRSAAAQEELLLAETRARDAARLTITQLQHQRTPKCGRRCGLVLGAVSIVALGIAVEQSRRLLYR